MEHISLKQKFKNAFSADRPVEVRTANMLFLGTGVISLIYAIAGFLIHFPWRPICINLVLSVYLLWMYFIAIKTNKQYEYAKISLIFMNFLFFPALFFTTGGIFGGTVSFFVLGIVFSYLMFTGRVCWFVITLEMLFYCSVIYYSYKIKLTSGHFDNIIYAYMMSSVNVVVAALAIGLLVRVLVSQYRKEKEKIDNAVQDLETLSTKDPLTGVYNRRYMLDFLEKNMKRSNDYGAMLSVVIFDIDFFKSLNDDFGHLVGDEILCNLCNVFSKHIRTTDMISRYGGEEFVAVFPNTPIETAYKRAEEIRKTVEESVLSEDVNRPITVSGGVAQYNKGMTIEELIEAADKNLYFAKTTGRNKICLAVEDDWIEVVK